MLDNRKNGYVLRGEEKRKQIIESAKAVFLENGYRNATVTLFAKHAGVGYGTVYDHFSKGKDEILLYIMEDIMGDFYKVASVVYTPESKSEAFRFTLKNTTDYLELATIHKNWLALFYEAIGHSIDVRHQWEEITEKFIERISQNVEIVKQKGLIRNVDFDTRVVAGLLYYPGENYLWKIALGKTSKDYRDIARDITEVYTHGLFK